LLIKIHKKIKDIQFFKNLLFNVEINFNPIEAYNIINGTIWIKNLYYLCPIKEYYKVLKKINDKNNQFLSNFQAIYFLKNLFLGIKQ